MEPAGWIQLGIGIVVIIGAWTNVLNYTGDESDGDSIPYGYTGALIFEFIFFKNRAAYKAFLFIVGICFVIAAFYFAPAVRAYFQSSSLN